MALQDALQQFVTKYCAMRAKFDAVLADIVEILGVREQFQERFREPLHGQYSKQPRSQ